MAGRRRKADADLILALACGATPEHAAQKAGLGLRTVYRRLAEPRFRARVDAVRADIVLDDIDGLYADRSGIRLLKALCQTERRGLPGRCGLCLAARTHRQILCYASCLQFAVGRWRRRAPGTTMPGLALNSS